MVQGRFDGRLHALHNGNRKTNAMSGCCSSRNLKEMILKNRLLAALGDRFAKVSALFFCTSLTLPALPQVGPMDMFTARLRAFPDCAAAQRREGTRLCPLGGNARHSDVHTTGARTYVLVH